ncbi:MAG: glycosyl hydrolase, partial [Bacteroidota bacterium]
MKKMLVLFLLIAFPFNSFSQIPDLQSVFSVIARDTALLEPEDGRVYHGAQNMTYETTPDPLAGYLGALNDSTIQPAVRGLFFSIPGTRGPDKSLKELSNFFANADSIGFIPELSLFFVSTVATDSIIAVSTQYDKILDSIATICKAYGKRMFLRIGGEFNGAGQDWNGGGYHPYYYVTMFKKVVNMFAAKGLRDSIAVIWCYEPDAPNDFDSVDSRGARWYPGDEYVDWFGLDVFDAEHFDKSLPDYNRGTITRKGKSERFLAMARSKGKSVYMSETSAKGVNISSDNQDGINDWNNWFVKFFEFIDTHKEIKGYSYIDANWPAGAYPGWGDSRIEKNQYVTSMYKEELKETKYIHLGYAPIPQQNDTIPLTELGTDKWKNYEGGLYPNGSNSRPAAHDSVGIAISKEITAIDTLGNPDNIRGKIVLLSIGMSNTTQEFSVFKQIADTFKLKNPKLTIVDGAQGGQTASIIKDTLANFWTVISQRLKSQNVSAKQVQAVWLKEANAGPTQAFPLHAQMLKDDLKKIVTFLINKYPNLQIVYLSSRIYGGYATSQLNPEPYAYESGFTIKWLIEEQINGDTSLIFSGNRRKAPWLSWGPYLWAKGTTARADGLTWLVQDFGTDGTHPSNSGRIKVANMLLSFLSTDETAKPWFLKSEDTTNVNEQIV